MLTKFSNLAQQGGGGWELWKRVLEEDEGLQRRTRSGQYAVGDCRGGPGARRFNRPKDEDEEVVCRSGAEERAGGGGEDVEADRRPAADMRRLDMSKPVVSKALEGPGGEKRGEGAKEMAAFTMQGAVAAAPGANQAKGTASKVRRLAAGAGAPRDRRPRTRGTV